MHHNATIYTSNPERIIEASIMVLITIVALVGNISFWIISLRDDGFRRNVSTWLLLCLSFADILVSVINMPLIVVSIVAGRWIFNGMLCTAVGFFSMLTFVGSVTSLASISLYRYALACHALAVKRTYTGRNTLLIIAGTWGLSVILSIPPLIGWGNYGYLPGQSICFCQWRTSMSYTYFMVVICFGGPCSIMIFSYTRILQKLGSIRARFRSAGKRESTTGTSDSLTGTQDDKSASVSTGTHFVHAETHETNGDQNRATLGIRDRDLKHTLGTRGAIDVAEIDMSTTTKSHLSGIDSKTRQYAYNTSKDRGHRNDYIMCGTDNGTVDNNAETTTGTEQEIDKDVCEINNTRSEIEGTGITNTRTVGDTNKVVLLSIAKIGRSEPKESIGHGRKRLSSNPNFSGQQNHDIKINQPVIRSDLRRKKDARSRAEVHLTMSFLIVTLVFVICWLPFCVTIFISIHSDMSIPRIPDMITIMLGCFNSCCNPIIYGVMNHKYKVGFTRLFCCKNTCR